MTDKMKVDFDVIDAYVGAFLYEPCNISTDSGPFLYLSDPPSVLPEYLQDFTKDEAIIVPGPEVDFCVGVCDVPHFFLSSETFILCSRCNSCVCPTCVCDFGESKLCLKCYSCKMSEPFLVKDHPKIDNQKTSLEMKSELDNAGVDVGEAATEYELEEIHDAYVTNKCVDRFRDNKVLFPIFKASYYGGMIGAHIMKFDLKEGGRFIADDRLTPKLLSDVVNLFSSLLQFDHKKYTSFNSQIYQALPTIFVDFAYGSRECTGYRLLERTARHAVDPNMADISDMDCRLFVYKGEIGIEFKGVVTASMKGCSYESCVSFTSSKLLC